MKLGIPHALLPLSALGLDRGRSLANANPTPEQVQRRRIEQFKYIVAQCSQAERLEDDDFFARPLRAASPISR